MAGTTDIAPRIRDASSGDLPAVQAIYAHHVLHGLGCRDFEPTHSVERLAIPAITVDRISPTSSRGPLQAMVARNDCELVCWSTCAVKDPLFQQVEVLPR